MADMKCGRKLVSVTMLPALYDKVLKHCKDNDIPMSLWVRQLIERELEPPKAT